MKGENGYAGPQGPQGARGMKVLLYCLGLSKDRCLCGLVHPLFPHPWFYSNFCGYQKFHRKSEKIGKCFTSFRHSDLFVNGIKKPRKYVFRQTNKISREASNRAYLEGLHLPHTVVLQPPLPPSLFSPIPSSP